MHRSMRGALATRPLSAVAAPLPLPARMQAAPAWASAPPAAASAASAGRHWRQHRCASNTPASKATRAVKQSVSPPPPQGLPLFPSTRACWYSCSLLRWPPPFLLPESEERFHQPSEMFMLQPPLERPQVAEGSLLLQPHDSAFTPGAPRPLADRRRDQHLLLTVTRYERTGDAHSGSGSGGGGGAFVSHASRRVVCAADSVETLVEALRTLVAPHASDAATLAPTLRVSRWQSNAFTRSVRTLLGLPAGTPRLMRGVDTRMSIADALFKAGAPVVHIPLQHAFRLNENGEVEPVAQPDTHGSASSSSAAAASPALLSLPLNGGLPVRVGELGFSEVYGWVQWVVLGVGASILYSLVQNMPDAREAAQQRQVQAALAARQAAGSGAAAAGAGPGPASAEDAHAEAVAWVTEPHKQAIRVQMEERAQRKARQKAEAERAKEDERR